MVVKPLIQLNNVSLTINKKGLLRDINLEIYENELFGIVGPSGHGKTTLLKTIIGYYKPTSGDIISEIRDKSMFGYASQDNSFYPELTIEENIMYFGKIYNLPTLQIRKNMEKVLELMQLGDRKEVTKNISGGMQRRMDIACAMIHRPKVLILDEPTTGLDPILRKSIWHLIEKLNAIGITIILSSHLLDEVELLCKRVAIMREGTIIKTTDIKSLRESSPVKEIHLVIYPGDYKKLAEYLGYHKIISSYKLEPHQAFLYTEDVNKAIYWILHATHYLKETVVDLDINQMTLGQLFEKLEE